MSNRKLLALAVACALAAAGSTTAIAQQRDLKARTPSAQFLQPLKLDLVMRADDPRMPQFCAAKGVRCPSVVSGGWVPGSLGAPDDLGTGYRNVLISLHVQQITNTPVASGGANADGSLFIHWLTGSAAADVEDGGPSMWVVPPPGESYSGYTEFSSPNGLGIYEAIKLNACGALGSFPIDHTGQIIDPQNEYGAFVGSDATIDATGYYNLSYTIRAEDSAGGVSDFRFEGIAVALCSGLSTL